MIIGKFQHKDGVYVGSVPAFAGTATVRITPTDVTGIDYRVTLDGMPVELGVGWNKVSKEKGTKYVSLMFDSPFLAKPAYCPLFEQKGGGYNLVWDRPEAKDKANPKAKKEGDQAAS
jgi:uncharacterized protein (DUF736 family)